MLLTGFEGYGGRSGNPSSEIVSALNGIDISGETVNGYVLPVTNHDLRENIAGLIEKTRPRLIVCMGLAPGEPVIRLERLAANYSCFGIPDNAGDCFTGAIVDGGPAAYDSSLPVDNILASLREQNIPARLSNTAGTFLCNAIFYNTMNLCTQYNLDVQAGFIHLPYMPSQVASLLDNGNEEVSLETGGSLASMSIEMQITAIRCVIATCVTP